MAAMELAVHDRNAHAHTRLASFLPCVATELVRQREQRLGDTLGELGDERVLLVEDPAAVGVDEPLAPGVDVAEPVPGVPDEPGGVADIGGPQPVWEWLVDSGVVLLALVCAWPLPAA